MRSNENSTAKTRYTFKVVCHVVFSSVQQYTGHYTQFIAKLAESCELYTPVRIAESRSYATRDQMHSLRKLAHGEWTQVTTGAAIDWSRNHAASDAPHDLSANGALTNERLSRHATVGALLSPRACAQAVSADAKCPHLLWAIVPAFVRKQRVYHRVAQSEIATGWK